NQSKWENVTSDNKKTGFEFMPDNILHIFGSKSGGYIAYMGEEITDFELHIEFQLTPKANSGVFFRSDLKDPVQKGFEIQVLEDYGQSPNKQGSGSLYDVATPMFNMCLPPGEWNSYDITCKGSHLIVIMNGWKVIDVDISLMTMPIGKFDTPLAQLPQKGYLQLQDHGGEVWYRNAYYKNIAGN
ncbi:MAG: 3-keto-disaccharide hydrolase, partial [Candidatus Hydrogenedens sp.]